MPLESAQMTRNAFTAARLAREQAKSPSKLRNKRCGKYASIREAKRAEYLKVLELKGEIFNLREQVRFDLLPAAPELGYKRPLVYVCDFAYFTWHDVAGPEVVEDAKGHRTEKYLIKKRLMAQLLGIQITEV